MELDELKNLWKKQADAFQPRNEAEIAAMLQGRSKSVIAKLKRNVWIELAFTCIAGMALLVYALTLEASAVKNISIAILLVFVAYSIYYIKKLILLNNFNHSQDDIRTSLKKLVENLSSYLKYYRLSYTILYPVYFVLGILLGGIERKEHFFDVLTEPRTIAILSVLALAFYFSSTWLVNWLLRKLYGNHLQKLQDMLHDLDEKHEG